MHELELIENVFVKNEPGFPLLDHIMKASFVRGLVANKVKLKSAEEIYIGYEGFDIELWILKNRLLRHMLIKRQGYKSFNGRFGHHAANKIRDNFLSQINTLYKHIEVEALSHFFDGKLLGEAFIKNTYSRIIESEKELVSLYDIDVANFICSTRVTLSQIIDVEADKENFIFKARRQAVIAAKHLQLLSLHSANGYNHEFSMRSMLHAVPPIERSKLEQILNHLLGDKAIISRVMHDGKDIGQCAIYNPYMEQPSFLSEIKKNWPVLTNSLTEVYRRQAFDIDIYLGLKNRVTNETEKFPSLMEIVERSIVDDKGYMINDEYAKFIIADALATQKILYVLNADREGILFLNARLGVEEVDKGLEKESLLMQAAARKIYHELLHLFPRLSLRINYVRRNVDENLIVIAIDPSSVKQFSDRIAERVIKECFYEMDMAIGALKEFKSTEEKSAFDSVTGGLFIRIPTDHFKDPEEVLKRVDFLSDRFKRARRLALDKLIASHDNNESAPYFTRDVEGNLAVATVSLEQKHHIEMLLDKLSDFFSIATQEKHKKADSLVRINRIPGVIFFQDLVNKMDFLNLDEKIGFQKYTNDEIKSSVDKFFDNNITMKENLIAFLEHINQKLLEEPAKNTEQPGHAERTIA